MRTKPLMNLTYTEGTDGMLYPDIDVSESKMDIGRFGQAWKAYMQEKHPQRLSELMMQGAFHSTMQKVDEEAENYKENMLEALLEQKPLPKTEDTLERAAHMEMLARTASEVTLNEIVFQAR